MQIPIYQLDAFTNQLFAGNPAAICLLDEWLSDDVLLKIAAENNLSETAFIVCEGTEYRIRWFTPSIEVDLCGHATLAAGYVMYHYCNYQGDNIIFNSKSGQLTVTPDADFYRLDFPQISATLDNSVINMLEECLGCHVIEAYHSMDYVAVVNNATDVANCIPNIAKINQLNARGLIITALGNDGYDFVSRWFGCDCGVVEDPATGSAHCILTPIWANKLAKTDLVARQLSSRGADFRCSLTTNRVYLYGQVVPYLVGSIII